MHKKDKTSANNGLVMEVLVLLFCAFHSVLCAAQTSSQKVREFWNGTGNSAKPSANPSKGVSTQTPAAREQEMVREIEMQRMASLIEGTKIAGFVVGKKFEEDFDKDGFTEFVLCEAEGREARIRILRQRNGNAELLAEHPANDPILFFCGDVDADGYSEVLARDHWGGSGGFGRNYVIEFLGKKPRFLLLNENDREVSTKDGGDFAVVAVMNLDKDGPLELLIPTSFADAGPRFVHEAWFDIMTWTGTRAEVVTKNFKDFYLNTFVPYWDAVGAGNDDAATNCRKMKEKFNAIFGAIEGKNGVNGENRISADEASRKNEIKSGIRSEGIPSFLDGWCRNLQRKVESVWVMPEGMNVTADNRLAQVEFWVDKSGNLMETPQVVKQAGDPALGKSGVQAIMKAAPFPPLPDAFDKPSLSIVYTFGVE